MLIRSIFEYFQKKRKVLTINEKMEILINLENGMKNWEICKKYNVSNSSAPCYRESRYREFRV